jgi:hypothetical protein
MLRRSAAAFVLSIFGSFGCSDPVPDPPRGNLLIHIKTTSDKPAGTQCPSISHDVNIGAPAPSLTAAGQLIKDGDGAGVYCSVKGGDPFNFYTKISQGATSFTMIGTVAAQGKGAANIVYTDNKLGATMENAPDKQCSVFVDEYSLKVAKGRIWARFECPQIKAAPSSYCSADGVFVFDNCE